MGLSDNTVVKATCSLLASLGLAACAPQTAPEATAGNSHAAMQDEIRALVRREMRKHKVVGLSLGLVDGPELVWAEGFGWADKAQKIPATAETGYRSGSVTKLFTASAAMQLRDAGKLDIDAPIDSCLPRFAIRPGVQGATRAPTAREIMSHHSGLPANLVKGMWSPRAEPFERVLDTLSGETRVQPPATVYQYSNLAMTLLGQCLQERAGLPFADLIARNLLQPLGMHHSAIEPGLSAKPDRALGYRKGRAETIPELRDTPAGGLNTSVADLARFVAMVLADGRSADGTQVLRAATLTEMLEPQHHRPLDFDIQVGLGWHLSGAGDIDIQGAGPVIHHAGGTLLFNSQLIALPEQQLGVVVLANSAESRGTVDRVATKLLKAALAERRGIEQPEPKPLRSPSATPSPHLSDFIGSYTTLVGLAHIEQGRKGLVLRSMGSRFDLIDLGDNALRLNYRLFGLVNIDLKELGRVELRLQRVEGRRVLTATLAGATIYSGERIEPRAIPEAWRQRLGTWKLTNLDNDILLFDSVRLLIEQEVLALEIHGNPKIDPSRPILPLIALDDEQARIPGVGRGHGETIRVERVGGVEQLIYAGLRLEKRE